MKFKSVVLLAVAVGCGLVAMLGVQQVLSSGNETVDEVGRVLVANAEIPLGTPLTEENTAFKEMPAAAIPEGAVTKPEEFEERAMNARAVPGEIIMAAKLGEKGVFGASNDIPTGFRVVTVSVNQTKTHSGLILPSDRVDVLVTYKSKVQGLGMVSKTKTVLEYIKVFATDSLRHGDVAGNENKEIHAKNISLLVTPDQANLLNFAENKGELHLSLRHKNDDAPANAVTIDDYQFEGGRAALGASNEKLANTDDKNTGDVRAFLDDQDKQPLAQVAVKEPETPKWKIVIFAGDERRVEEVDLPEQEQSEVSEDTSAI